MKINNFLQFMAGVLSITNEFVSMRGMWIPKQTTAGLNWNFSHIAHSTIRLLIYQTPHIIDYIILFIFI